MLTLRYEVSLAEACILLLAKSIHWNLDLRIELLSKIPEDLFFSKCIAVEEELCFWVILPVPTDQGVNLLECFLLTWEEFCRGSESIVHVQCVEAFASEYVNP